MVIEVRDEGEGMSQETLAHITDTFFTTRGGTDGTGIGLAIAHDIVERHNGDLTFASELGKGTTATLTLLVRLESVS